MDIVLTPRCTRALRNLTLRWIWATGGTGRCCRWTRGLGSWTKFTDDGQDCLEHCLIVWCVSVPHDGGNIPCHSQLCHHAWVQGKGLEENKTKYSLLLRSANQMHIMAHCLNKFHHLPPGQAGHSWGAAPLARLCCGPGVWGGGRRQEADGVAQGVGAP